MKQHLFDNGLGLSGVQVDRGNGIIRGVSVITAGITARGHDLEVDMTTLRQIKECGEKMGTVPTKWNHKTGADAVNGYLKNFYLEGNQLKADWHLLKSHSQFEQALELAERMPKNVGLSAAFLGDDEPIDKEGKKLMAARCDTLISVDLVPTPAANPSGLLQAKLPELVDDRANDETSMDPKNNPNPNAPELTLNDVMAAITGLQETVAAQGQQIAAIQEASQEDGPSLEEILSLSEEQIADLVASGEITEEDAAGIAALQAEYAAGDEEGAPSTEGAPAETEGAPAGAEAGTALSALTREVRMLQARLSREDADAEAAEEAHHFETIEGNLKAFSDENTSLKSEVSALKSRNEVLLHAIKTGTRVLSFSADGTISPVTSKDGKVHDFEQKVSEIEKSGKSRAKAFESVIKTNPELHRDWLESQRA
jgi:hypothetical protein